MNKIFIAKALIVAALFSGLAFGLIKVNKLRESKREVRVAGQVKVSLSPSTINLQPSGTSVVNINLTNTGKEVVDLYASEIDLQFNVGVLTVSNLKCNAEFLPSASVNSAGGGNIYLGCFTPGGSGSKSIPAGGTQTLGSFTVVANSCKSSEISVVRAAVPEAKTLADLSGNTGSGSVINCSSTTSPE